ncbi:MAG: nitrile hydratase subunit beta [Betaproteobacteria bacterium]|nr:MAG: nitrile hydratase subunit beta [Betaproteobacteria bacterium]
MGGLMLERGYHDLGGRPAGEIDRHGHEYAEWERRVDALAVLLWGLKGGPRVITVDEHRKNIEALPPEDYDKLAYYEKWIVSLTQCLLQRGVVTTGELARKMLEVQSRG